MRSELTDLSSSLDIPMLHGACVTIPNCTPTQKTAVLRIMHRILRTTKMRAWEKQAVKKLSKVVRSSPHSVQMVFSKLSTSADWNTDRPTCTCTANLATAWSHHGHRRARCIDPCHRDDELDHTLRPRDQLAVPGRLAREAAKNGITAFARRVHGKVPDLDRLLPPSLFSNTGHTLRRFRHIVEQPSQSFYVRIVDKGAGQLLGFCRLWVWDQTASFLTQGGYQNVPGSTKDSVTTVSRLVQELGWSQNKQARLCRLYIIGKAKSLWAGKGWLWRPIAASPSPIVLRAQLRAAARAFTRFLAYLISEILAAFLRLAVTDLASWFAWCTTQNLTTLTELGCKEQFNNISPQDVYEEMQQASEWLTKKWRWRMNEVVWSIHHSHKKLDRAGKASAHGFRYIQQDSLNTLVRHDLSLGPPLMTPGYNYHSYLPSILIGELKNGLPWTSS